MEIDESCEDAGANQRRNRQSSHCQQKEQLRLRLLSTVTMGKGWPSRLSGATWTRPMVTGGGAARMKARTNMVRPESALDRSRSREKRRAARDDSIAKDGAVDARADTGTRISKLGCT